MIIFTNNCSNRYDGKFSAQYFDSSIGSLYQEGKQFIEEGKTDSAIQRFVRIKQIYHSDLPDEESRICVAACQKAGDQYYEHYSDYKNAYDCLITAKEIAEEKSYVNMLPDIYIGLANIYYLFRDVKMSVTLAKKAYHMARMNKDTLNISRTMNNMVLGCYDYGNFTLIEPEIKDFESLATSSDNQLRFTSKMVESALHYKKGDSKGTIASIDSAINIAKGDLPIGRHLEAALSLKTFMLQQNKDYPAAISTMKLMDDKRSLDKPDIRISYLQFLTRLYDQSGNVDSFHYYALKYIDASESMFGSKTFGTIKDLESSRKIEKADRQIHYLELKNGFHRIIIIIFAIASLIVTVLLVIVINQKKSLYSRNEELFRKNEDFIKELAGEKERYTAYIEMLRSQSKQESETFDIQETRENDAVCPDVADDAKIDEEMIQVAEIISATMESDPEIYQENYSVDRLAEKTGLPQKKVSKVLNTVLGKNFPTYLGELRVREACRRLTDTGQYGHLTLEGIAKGCGFKSRTNFISVFKKITGLNPSDYRKIALSKQNKIKNRE